MTNVMLRNGAPTQKPLILLYHQQGPAVTPQLSPVSRHNTLNGRACMPSLLLNGHAATPPNKHQLPTPNQRHCHLIYGRKEWINLQHVAFMP